MLPDGCELRHCRNGHNILCCNHNLSPRGHGLDHLHWCDLVCRGHAPSQGDHSLNHHCWVLGCSHCCCCSGYVAVKTSLVLNCTVLYLLRNLALGDNVLRESCSHDPFVSIGDCGFIRLAIVLCHEWSHGARFWVTYETSGQNWYQYFRLLLQIQSQTQFCPGRLHCIEFTFIQCVASQIVHHHIHLIAKSNAG